MSCLYSSPEVISLEVTNRELPTLDCRNHRRPIRCGASCAHRIAIQFNSIDIARRVQQRRVPQQPGRYRRLHRIIQPAKTSTGFLREFSSAISGFRSLCGRKLRSSFSHRAQLTCVLEPFTGRALALRTLAFNPLYPFGIPAGPVTLDRCCRRNVVAPGDNSK
jgi:hypothetical protein